MKLDPPTLVDLSNQVAVVTGGSRGLGQIYAIGLAAAGASVAVIARSADSLQETVEYIAETKGQATAFIADVTDRTAVEKVARQIEKQLGPVDLLINNAGILPPLGPIWEIDPEVWWRNIEVNLRGPLLLTRSILPAMIARRQGRIINIASEVGLEGKAYLSPYVVSKTALIRFSENVALETEKYGVCVFAICPGAVQTNMTDVRFSTEGQKWIPWCQEIFEKGLNVPSELAMKMILQLASGKYDELSGRFIQVRDDLSQMQQRCQEIKENNLYELRLHRLNSLKELEPFIPVGQRYILVNINDWPHQLLENRQAIPFLEKEGIYWGLPPDDQTAINELERLRHQGAKFIVFGCPAFWWLDYYTGFSLYLRNNFPCVLENERLIVFDLHLSV